MRVVVDREVCVGNGVCMGIAPAVFEIQDDGFLEVLDEHPPEALREDVAAAINSCPTGALSAAKSDDAKSAPADGAAPGQ